MILDETFKILFKKLEDGLEKCRELSIQILTQLFEHCEEINENLLSYLFPVIIKRLNAADLEGIEHLPEQMRPNAT